MYLVRIEPDDNGTLLVTCPDLPELVTFGRDRSDALRRGVDAVEEALAARIAHGDEIPAPSSTGAPDAVILPLLMVAKVELYRAARVSGVSKQELGRRLGWPEAEVDRLFDVRYQSSLKRIDAALRAIGKRLTVAVEDAA